MKKRKYYLVILLLVISFFSLLLVACSSNDNVEDKQTEQKDNKEKETKKDSEQNKDVNQDDPNENLDEDDPKELEPSPYYFLDDYDNRIDLRSEDQIEGYKNYEKDIYFVSNKIKNLNVGDAITICNQKGVVGLNVFNTMANCLIYVNALGPDTHPTIYLDSGIINEVFHFYHNNLTVYGPYAGISDESLRDASLEAIFTGSVSVRGDNITIDGVAVNDLEHTITIYGKNTVLSNIVQNKNNN